MSCTKKRKGCVTYSVAVVIVIALSVIGGGIFLLWKNLDKTKIDDYTLEQADDDMEHFDTECKYITRSIHDFLECEALGGGEAYSQKFEDDARATKWNEHGHQPATRDHDEEHVATRDQKDKGSGSKTTAKKDPEEVKESVNVNPKKVSTHGDERSEDDNSNDVSNNTNIKSELSKLMSIKLMINHWMLAKAISSRLSKAKEWAGSTTVWNISRVDVINGTEEKITPIANNMTILELNSLSLSSTNNTMDHQIQLVSNVMTNLTKRIGHVANKTTLEVETLLSDIWNDVDGIGNASISNSNVSSQGEEEKEGNKNRMKRSISNNNNVVLKKKHVHGPNHNKHPKPKWRQANAIPSKFTISFSPDDQDEIGHERSEDTLDPYNNVHLERFLYKHDTSNAEQRQPPWSFSGQNGVSQWHKMELEKLMVPVIDELGNSERERVFQASMTDLFEEKTLFEFLNNDVKSLINRLDAHIVLGFDGQGQAVLDQNAFPRFYVFYDKDFNYYTATNYLPRIIKEKGNAVDVNRDPQGRPLNRVIVRDIESNKRVFKNTSSNLGGYSQFRFYIPPAASAKVLKDNKVTLRTFSINLIDPWELERILEIFQFFLEDEKENPDNPKRKQTQFELFRLKEATLQNILIPYNINHDKVSSCLETIHDPQTGRDACVKVSADPIILHYLNKWVTETFEKKVLQAQYSLPIFPKRFPICQDQEPSPLNIVRSRASRSSIRPYIFNDRSELMYRFKISFPPDGTNVLSVTLEDSDKNLDRAIQMSGGATRGLDLFFEEMFIKVGHHEGRGTEHKLDGVGYDLELQMLFSYRGNDRSQPWWFTLARQVNDLFAFREKLVIMLSVLVKVNDTLTDKNPEDFYRFEPLAQGAREFHKQFTNNPKARHYRAFTSDYYVFRLKNYIPKGPFYTYRGSMTIPPCFGYVLWSVYNETLSITRDQYDEFRLIPTPGIDLGHFAGSIRREQDIHVAVEENARTPTIKKQLRDKRLERAVLLSVDEGGDEFDYYFDPDDDSCRHSSSIYITITITLLTVFLNL